MGLNKLYPFECIKIENDEKKVMELYNIMCVDGKEKGYTPVIIIEDGHGLMEENVKFANEDFGSIEKFTEACLEEYPEIDLKDFFAARKDYYDQEDKVIQLEGDIVYEESNSVYIGESDETVYIAKVPTEKPYEVMAYLPMGGFNDCPDNALHVALAKYWYEKYQAYPVVIGCDTIQFKVDKPVADSQQLEELANEQYLYCGDIIWQGVETLNNLKSSLSNSYVWYFWWD